MEGGDVSCLPSALALLVHAVAPESHRKTHVVVVQCQSSYRTGDNTMKRFALFAFAFIWLAACDTPSAPTPPTPTLKMVPVGAPSSAKLSNEKFYISFTAFNPCPPTELVAVEGWYHYLVTGEQTPAGSDIKIHLNTQGIEGVGLTSGDRYQFIQNQKSDFEFSNVPPFPFEQEFDFRYQLIRQGSDDNLWIRQTTRFSYPPYEFEIIRNEFECRG